jgi:hypothetical protein
LVGKIATGGVVAAFGAAGFVVGYLRGIEYALESTERLRIGAECRKRPLRMPQPSPVGIVFGVGESGPAGRLEEGVQRSPISASGPGRSTGGEVRCSRGC